MYNEINEKKKLDKTGVNIWEKTVRNQLNEWKQESQIKTSTNKQTEKNEAKVD